MCRWPRWSLSDLAHVGTVVQAVVVLFGVGFAFYEIQSAKRSESHKQKEATFELQEYLEPKMDIRELEGVDVDIWMVVGFKEALERIVMCVETEVCHPDASKLLFCKYFEDYQENFAGALLLWNYEGQRNELKAALFGHDVGHLITDLPEDVRKKLQTPGSYFTNFESSEFYTDCVVN